MHTNILTDRVKNLNCNISLQGEQNESKMDILYFDESISESAGTVLHPERIKNISEMIEKFGAY